MKRAPGGYTIVEVLMALGVSTMIFMAGIMAFRGQQGETEFTQTMVDIESKIKSYVTKVGAGSLSETREYTCNRASSGPNTGKPVLRGGALINTQDCINFGRAVQVLPGQNRLFSYIILGCRLKNCDTNDKPVRTFDSAVVEPALSAASESPPNSLILIDEYRLAYGATIKSSTVDGGTDPYHLAGIYTSLEEDTDDGTPSAAVSLLLKGYPIDFTSDSNPQSRIQRCIEKAPATGCNNLINITRWDLCVQSGDGEWTAVLSLNKQPSGITTKITYKDC